jgi:predicted lactoylglutathione lyase
MEQRLSFVTLGVADVARGRAFYERLGWKASSASVAGEVAFFQAGAIVFALFDRAAMAKDAQLPPERIASGGVSLAYNVRRKEEVDAVLAEAVAAGARLLKPAQQASWGGYTGHFADPDGHPWEVACNPYFPMDASGSVRVPD